MHEDDMEVSWEDLELDEIGLLLEEAGQSLSAEQLAQLAELLSAAGGIEAAMQALAELGVAGNQQRPAA
jgi:hypothetical protein